MRPLAWYWKEVGRRSQELTPAPAFCAQEAAPDKKQMDDIFGGSDSDDDLALDDSDDEKPAAAAAKAPAAAEKDDSDSDDDLDLELDSDSDSDDETEKKLAALVARQKGKGTKRKAAPKKKAEKKSPAEKKPRKSRTKAAAKPKIPKKRKQPSEGGTEGASGGGSGDEAETAEDRAFVEHTGDTDDEGDVIKTKGGWGDDADIEGSGEEDDDPLNQTDKKWLDQMWGRGQKKDKGKSLDEYKLIALKASTRRNPTT